MFKKLRNKLLIINTLIIAALVLGSFSVIYLMTDRNVTRSIEQKLDRALDFVYTQRMPKQMRDDMRRPENEPPEGVREAPPDENEKPKIFSLTFTVTTDSEGNVEKADIPFELNEDFYSEKMREIISADTDRGRLKTDSGYWIYRTVPVDNGYVTAFTECRAEHTMLRNLFILLIFVGLFALTAAFLISLYSANNSIRPIEESYNKQKQFVADASHELKTPLTTINTNIDVLLSHTESTIGEERKWLDYIKTEAERMTKLTNDLLYLARLDHGDSGVILTAVSFSEAAESVILLMEAVVFENNVNLSYDIAPGLLVNGSAEQLRQLVMILLDNAVKYTPKSGDINIKLERDGADAVFSIRNSGEGISEEAQKQIFERFYREDKSRARESGGYGLGLAIAKAITVSCKGSIRVNSKKDEFTEFTVKIPLVK